MKIFITYLSHLSTVFRSPNSASSIYKEQMKNLQDLMNAAENQGGTGNLCHKINALIMSDNK